MKKIDSHPKEFERALIPRPSTPHSRWVPPSWGLITATSPKNSKVFISLMPCTFSKILEQNFSYYTDKLLSLHWFLINEHLKVVKNSNIWQSAKRITHTEEHTQRSKCVKFPDSYFENHHRNAKMSQSKFVSLCGYFMSCDTLWLSRLCELST